MTAIVAIAKGIGIFLLVLLALALFVLLSVLFVPVRYRAEGEYREGFRAIAEASWFFHLIRLRASWDGGFSCSLRAAGIPLYSRTETGEGESPPPGENRRETGRPEGESPPGAVPESGEERREGGRTADVGPEPKPDVGPEPDAKPDMKPDAKPDIAPDARQEPPRDPDAAGDGRKGGAGKRRRKPGTFRLFRQKIRGARQRFAEKWKDAERAKERLLQYRDLLCREDSQRALSRAAGEGRRLLSHCLPRSGLIRIAVGTEDPAITGGLLALQGMLYPLICDRIVILPDFETPRLEGTFSLGGRIRACAVCYCLLRVLLNRDCRLLLARLRKKEEARLER